MTSHTSITAQELQTLKEFWTAEDERNGGRSDCSRCIAEIERLNEQERSLRKAAQEVVQRAYQYGEGMDCEVYNSIDRLSCLLFDQPLHP